MRPALTADEGRRDRQAQLVEQAVLDERAEQRRAALGQDPRQPASASTASTEAESTLSGSPIEQSMTSAQAGQRAPGLIGRRRAGADQRRHLGAGEHRHISLQATGFGDDRHLGDLALPAGPAGAAAVRRSVARRRSPRCAPCPRRPGSRRPSSRSAPNTARSPGPPSWPDLPPKVAPPSRLAMKLARNHTPPSVLGGVGVELGEIAAVDVTRRAEQSHLHGTGAVS